MDDEKGDPPRTCTGDGSVHKSFRIQRVIRAYNEAHWLLLESVVVFLCNSLGAICTVLKT